MAEFCLECFNKIHGSKYTKFDVIEEWGLCEECGEHKIVVVDLRGFGKLNFVSWIFNRIELKALTFYDKYLWKLFKNIRYRYTAKQRQAIAGKISMTEGLYWECFNVAWYRYDNLALRELLHKYPRFMEQKYIEIEKRLEDNPEMIEEEKHHWQCLLSRMEEELGEEFVKTHYRS